MSKAKENNENANETQPLLHKAQQTNQQLDEESWGTTESEVERRRACRGMSLTALALFLTLIILRYFIPWFFRTGSNAFGEKPAEPASSKVPARKHFPRPDHKLQHVVKTGREGFPSYWDYAQEDGRAIHVSYDGRSFFLNNQRALFLSGSMHPSRATKATWENVLDLAVENGLNMVTIYVFWADHQPLPGQAIDWTLPGGRGRFCSNNETSTPCGWSLADAIRAAALRGLWVHARIGPYVCAEYNYGGIPEWVPLSSNMRMRRLDPQWLDAMEGYVNSTINYLTENTLFAYQGGPIVAGQIENELGEENVQEVYMDMPVNDDSLNNKQRELNADGDSAPYKTIHRGPSVQDYADWCGSLVKRLAPKVVWTMCNGLSANNTIVTCNGNGECSQWLEGNGSSGRIQVDQPAMWTEDEGGFQLWGEDANSPRDYFWGRTAREMGYDALRWFARGGTHLNYYMFWGSYNRGRASASGIMNAYATDAPICTSGQPRQPKYNHFRDLHLALLNVAPTLLNSSTALNKGMDVKHRTKNGGWQTSGKQVMFLYSTNTTDNNGGEYHEVVFVENDADHFVDVKLDLGVVKNETVVLEMSPHSAVLLKDARILFESSNIKQSDLSYDRNVDPDPVLMSSWSSCPEPIGPPAAKAILKEKPVEQTLLNIGAGISSDYAWYEVEFNSQVAINGANIYVETQKGSAFTCYINDQFQGEAYNLNHAEGDVTLQFHVSMRKGLNTLSLLSENLGFHNLIGRWGVSPNAKVKGITGDVILATKSGNRSLIGSGLVWKSSPGLNRGEHRPCPSLATEGAKGSPKWYTTTFDTPIYDPKTRPLFLNITKGRGHVWLNGHDLGRFWNVTRSETDKYSQQFYFLPFDYLEVYGNTNKLVFFDALGSDISSTNLVLSWLDETNTPNFEDEIDFPAACM